MTLTTNGTAPGVSAAPPANDPAAQPIKVNLSCPAEIPDPERAFVGCLLRLDARGALDAATLVQPSEMSSPVLAELLATVTALAHVGIDPEPNAVLNLLRSAGRANGERRRQATLLLADLYASTAVPASASFYAAAVLREASRRRAREAGERIAQAAELEPIDSLAELIERELVAVQGLAEWAGRVSTS